MTGTELKIVLPAETEVLGPEVDRLPTLHTNARTDAELLTVWLKSHADGSAHTRRAYQQVGAPKADGSPVKPATVNMYVAAGEVVRGLCTLTGGRMSGSAGAAATPAGADTVMADEAKGGALKIVSSDR